MKRVLVWVHKGRRVRLSAISVQLVCTMLLLGACDMNGSAVPTALPSGTTPPSATLVASASATAITPAHVDGNSVPTLSAISPTPASLPTDTAGAEVTVTITGTETPDLNSVLTVVPDAASPTPVPLAAISSDAKVLIYGLVVADLLKSEKARNVYISPYVGQGERLDAPNEAMPVPATLDHTLQARDKGHSYSLVEFADAVGALEDGGKVKDNGAFITLGEITVDGSGKDIVLVHGSLYRGVANGTGNAYRFQQDLANNTWKLLDVTSDWNDQQ